MGVADAAAETVTEDTIREYVRWLNHEGKTPHGKPLSHGTKDDRLKSLGTIWRRLTQQGLAPKGSADLWRGHDLSGKRKPQDGDAGEKRPYTDEEIVRLLAAAPPGRSRTYDGRTLHEINVLGFLTGARLDEICSRSLGEVEATADGYILHIRRSKTASGIRSIPIVHPIAVALLKRRIGKRTDKTAQLFPECKPGGKDKKLSHYTVTALANLRAHAGFTSETDFHSTRRNLSSILEAREVYPIAAHRYVGHEPPGLTFGLYAQGEREALHKVAKAIKYPATVERAMRQALDL
jgi:integrase